MTQKPITFPNIVAGAVRPLTTDGRLPVRRERQYARLSGDCDSTDR